MGEIIFVDEIPCGDEIRLDAGWVDLISSAKQISSKHRLDFIVSEAKDFIKTEIIQQFVFSYNKANEKERITDVIRSFSLVIFVGFEA